jgi:hypothetical protein
MIKWITIFVNGSDPLLVILNEILYVEFVPSNTKTSAPDRLQSPSINSVVDLPYGVVMGNNKNDITRKKCRVPIFIPSTPYIS